MKNIDFVNKAIDVAKNYKTLYVLGCFGSPMTSANKAKYISKNAYNKGKETIINAASSDTFGFDCVCLIKGILWGWNGDKSKSYGGATYISNGVKDIDADTMCTSSYSYDISTDFSNIQIGELLSMKGHIGIYIGDGLAVECSPKWSNKVQITAVGNIGAKSGYNTRTWTKHCRSNYIDYTIIPTKTIDEVAQEVIDGLWGTGTTRKTKLIEAGYNYSNVQAKVNEIIASKKAVVETPIVITPPTVEEPVIETPKEDNSVKDDLKPVLDTKEETDTNTQTDDKQLTKEESITKNGIIYTLFGILTVSLGFIKSNLLMLTIIITLFIIAYIIFKNIMKGGK